MTDTKSISLKLAKSLHQQLQKQVIADGYGMRGKSKWVKEAIESFLELNYFPSLVDELDDFEELTDILTIRIPSDICEQLSSSLITVRKEYPAIEGVKSKIIRSSILQRMVDETPPAEIYVTA